MGYMKKTWRDGEVITPDALNNIEGGIAEANSTASASKVLADESRNLSKQNSEKIKNQNSEVEELKARMDLFASLPEGSTTGDAELADMRFGADGVTYPTAGEAQRTQFNAKVDKSAIVQTTGDSETAVMSQVAVTKIINEIATKKTDSRQIFDYENCAVLDANLSQGAINGPADGVYTVVVPCEPKTTYTLSLTTGSYNRFGIGETANEPVIGDAFDNAQYWIDANKNTKQENGRTYVTGTTLETTRYLLVFYYNATLDTVDESVIRKDLMVTKGDTLYPFTEYRELYFPNALPVVQETGLDENAIMSQKATTEELNKKATEKNNIIEYHKQLVFHGDSTYHYKDIFIYNPVIGESYSVLVGNIENSPAHLTRCSFLAENGATIVQYEIFDTENAHLTVRPFEGVACLKFTLYASKTGGLSDTTAFYKDVYVVKGRDLEYKLQNIPMVEVAPFIPSNTVKTIAHRGLCNKLVTQDLPTAYIECRKMGYTCAENDLQTTSDGVFVMNHETEMNIATTIVRNKYGWVLYKDENSSYCWKDDVNDTVYKLVGDDEYEEINVDSTTLVRVKGSEITVSETPYVLLKQIIIGRYNEHMMTFKEWILLMKRLGMNAYVDCKNSFTEAQWGELVGIVRSLGMLKHTTWIVGGFTQADYLRAKDPAARFGFVSALTDDQISTLGGYADGGEVIYYATAQTLTEEVAEKVRENCITLETWIVSNNSYCNTAEAKKAEIDRVVELGVEAIAMDYCRIEDLYNFSLT